LTTKKSGALLPDEVVLLAAAKRFDFNEAKNESINYSISSVEQSDGSVFNLQLALPYTATCSRLDVHVEINDGLWVIPHN